MNSPESINISNRARKHKILIIGGGSAGISVAARLRRAGEKDVAVIEPSENHYFQPSFTLVGGGARSAEASFRPTNSVIPSGVHWIRDRVATIDADGQKVATESSGEIGYEFLVAAPGIQLDWDRIPGRQCLQQIKGGTALFTCPTMPIKCAGAPQKIMYLTCDYLRQRELLDKTQVIFGTATPSMFAVPEFSKILDEVVQRYEIDARFNNNLVRVDPDRRDATFEVPDGEGKREVSVHYDFLHAVPPQSAPDFIKSSPLAGPAGWIEVDQNTLRHTRYPNVFALGDATTTPNTKTAAAVKAQAPVVVENLLAAMSGRDPSASYGGYGACPLITSYRSVLMAEFDYTKKPTPLIPLINTMKERYDMWLVKKYGLPWFYWNLMLKGRA